MKRILVAYTTNAGSTEEVAQAIGTELGQGGSPVDVRRLEEVTSLESYQVAVIGAPMILGWHRGAVRFVKKHESTLCQIPVAYFATAMSLTQTGESQVGSVPVYVDPTLAKPPNNPGRLGLKERYARLPNYVRPMLKAAPSVKPVSIGMFGGKLELFRLKILQMLFVMLVIQAPPGDLRNWEAIRAWAAGLRTTLLEPGI
jgi:menaquinone-dependent protoporphyrinogen IX oxidase